MLTEREQRVLDIAARHYRHQAMRETAIRAELDLSWTRYNVALNQLLDRPEALAYAPGLVYRMRRLRAARSRSRTAA